MKYSDGKPYKVIAVCMAKFNNSEETEFISDFHKVCVRNNFKMFIFSSLEDFYFENVFDRAEEQIYSLMEPEKFDAVVISSLSFKRDGIAERIAERVRKAGVPCISLVRPIEGCINNRFNFKDSFEEVVRHVVEVHKPKHINFIAGLKNNIFSDQRLEVFKKVLRENNIRVEGDRIDWGDFWEEPTDKVMERFLASGKPIDAIICANDFMAMEVCRKLKEAGLRVPEDVIVAGFDGVDLEKYHYPRLCTSYVDNAKMAEMVVTILKNIFDGKEIEPEYMLGCTFRAGQSCGCHRKEVALEEVDQISQKLFHVAKHEKVMISRVEEMYTKFYELGHFENLPMIWDWLVYYINRFFGGDFWLALNVDFLSPQMDLWPNLRPLGQMTPHHYYTDELRIPVECVNQQFTSGNVITRKELIPDFEEAMSRSTLFCLMPLYVQESTVGYAVSAFDPEGFEFSMLYSFVINLRNVIEMHKYRIDQMNLYSTDQLTRLFNRKGFYNHMGAYIAGARSRGEELCLISVDMNWLKHTNDTFGHAEGDFAISKVAQVLQSAADKSSILTRFGGDEFAVAFAAQNAAGKAEEVIAAILRDLDAFNQSKVKPYPLSVSYGYVVHVPDDDYPLERFIREADRAMYENKAKYKETHTWDSLPAAAPGSDEQEE